MTFAIPRIATAMNSSTDARVLQTLGMEGVSLALWERSLPDELARELDALPPERLPRMRRRLAVRHVSRAIRQSCEDADAGACSKQLADVVQELSKLAMGVFASPMLELRLDVTDGQPCPKWHVDAVSGRLLCTLRGPGTEYGPIGPGGKPESIHRMARGAVGVFRGALWPGQELAAIVHRSPPREAGGTRLLVVIDPVDDAGAC
ncbi:DUF1826 domain-containing protein [Algicella marina]|uniref:DUF1826 domain-containing protein n=1 Tax=Algicella marina TaxID=2683284 RepID=A0A6P1T1E4_9RHOB|nr:DUF1826 domain-containing protein [Algicella marina]QHQ35807.1 DUF1826 domain-containing protein [Algicella marina]